MSKPRVLAFDIEATGLKADFAFLLCAAFGDVDTREVKVLSLDDYGPKTFANEQKLVRDVIAEMNRADMLITYFGTRYDKPFINAKAYEYGMLFPAPVPHVDLFYTVKSNLAISRKSLQNVGYYGMLTTEKTPVEGRLWKAAQAGDLRALQMIKDHNAADVLILAEAYERLRPLIRMHPRLTAGTDSCRGCQSTNLQRRGYAFTAAGVKKQRVQCQDCGSWSTVELEEKDATQEKVATLSIR